MKIEEVVQSIPRHELPTLVALALTRLLEPAAPPPVVKPEAQMLDVAEAAKLLGLSPKSVIKAARAGELPARKIGSRYRFSRAALLGAEAQNLH
jgi:excisionase family DNA binding protein